MEITVDPNNLYYCSLDGVLFDKSLIRIIKYPSGRVESYTIPDGVQSIPGSAFSYSSLTNLVIPNSVVSIDSRPFPRCDNLVMMRHYFSVKRHVTVDECPGCAGYWLDPGELAAIRNQFATEEERKEAAENEFSDMLDSGLANIRERSRNKLEKARSVARMLRFICPSYYIPGKQDFLLPLRIMLYRHQ